MRFPKRSSTLFIFIGAIALWLFQQPAFACSNDGCNPEEASLRLAGDFDGDHKIDSARARVYGSSYSIEVRLSTKRPRVRLTAPKRHEVGLELLALDVDQDRRADLILLSASSVQPVAVWLNKGNGSFERSSKSFAPLFGTTDNPRLRRATARSDAQAAMSSDDSPDGFEPAENFAFGLEPSPLRPQSDRSPLSIAARGAASSRAPPSNVF